MKVKVRFRYNSQTGEVRFLVDDEGGDRLPEGEHDRVHDELARDVASVVEIDPEVEEVIAHGMIPERRTGTERRIEGEEVEGDRDLMS